jgi:hypothetical protein
MAINLVPFYASAVHWREDRSQGAPRSDLRRDAARPPYRFAHGGRPLVIVRRDRTGRARRYGGSDHYANAELSARSLLLALGTTTT